MFDSILVELSGDISARRSENCMKGATTAKLTPKSDSDNSAWFYDNLSINEQVQDLKSQVSK